MVSEYFVILCMFGWIAQEIASNIELTGGWDPDLVIICLDHDINMLRRTLETGIVTEH